MNYLSAAEAATKLNISVQAIHRLALRGTLPYVRIAGRRYFTLAAIEKYLADPELQSKRRPASAIRQGQRVLSLDELTKELGADRLRKAGQP
jgi:excisionase family DNA binding protein